MKKVLGLFIFLAACQTIPQESDESWLFKAGETTVQTDEFLYAYQKNKTKSDSIDVEADLRDYLDLYVNFKLKVLDARANGMDTTPSYKLELEGYRKQLAEPYMTESSVTEQLLQEAYDRMKTEVRASHILVVVNPTASPKDTMNSYNYIQDVRNRALNGEDFKELALQYSQDPSAKGNGGDLGYFSALQMVYPFEDAAFTTEIGDISPIIRTKFGFHIIKVTDKRESRGQIKVSHLMVRAQNNIPKQDSILAKSKIDEIRRVILAGNLTWNEACAEFSEDVNTRTVGGQLPWLGTGNVPPSFEDAAFAIENPGDISPPVKTDYGWHLIKLDDKRGLESFESMKEELERRIQRDTRADLSQKAFIARVKRESNFTFDQDNYDSAIARVDSALLTARWKVPDSLPVLPIFTLGEKNFTSADFYEYLNRNQRSTPGISLITAINNYYQSYEELSVRNYEEEQLPEKYFEYRMLLQEYSEGIMLFALMDMNVWTKAIRDTTGLETYYEENASKYTKGETVQGTIYNLASDSLRIELQAMIDREDTLIQSKNALISYFNENSPLNLQVEEGTFDDGYYVIQNIPEKVPGIYNLDLNNRFYLLIVDKIGKPAPPPLEDIRGYVISDYQKYLEDRWIRELKDSYEVKINEKVLKDIIAKFESE